MYTENELLEMSESQLCLVADSLGVPYNPNAVISTKLREMILAAQPKKGGKAAPPKARRAPKSHVKATDDSATPEKSEKYYWITVHNQEGVESTPFVKVQPNGKMFTLPREVKVKVPAIVVRVLEDAVITRHVPTPDGKGLTTISQRRIPFSVHGEA